MSLSVPGAVFYTGIDWAAEAHAVCVMDPSGKVVARFTIAHSAEGLDRLIRKLAGLGDPADMPVAIERPSGALVDALLDAHWPGGKAIFADLDSRIALEFLTRYPAAASAAHLDEAGIAAFCRQMGYSGKRPAAVLLQRLRAAPARSCGDALTAAVRDAVLALVTVVTAITAATRNLDKSVAARLGEHPDSEIFTSLPRSGQVNAAQMLAEWGDCRQAYDGPDSVAALAGVTPVTKESGKHRGVHFRWACNKRFRQAITTFADNSRHASPWAAKIYSDARAAGKDHPHAIRILARAWIRVIWPCWINGIPYDPDKHGAAAALMRHAMESLAA